MEEGGSFGPGEVFGINLLCCCPICNIFITQSELLKTLSNPPPMCTTLIAEQIMQFERIALHIVFRSQPRSYREASRTQKSRKHNYLNSEGVSREAIQRT